MKINQIFNKLNVPVRILIPYHCGYCFYTHKVLLMIKNKEGFFRGTGKCPTHGKKEQVFTFLEKGNEYVQERVEINGETYTLVINKGQLTTARWGFVGHYRIDRESGLAWKDGKSYAIKYI